MVSVEATVVGAAPMLDVPQAFNPAHVRRHVQDGNGANLPAAITNFSNFLVSAGTDHSPAANPIDRYCRKVRTPGPIKVSGGSPRTSGGAAPPVLQADLPAGCWPAGNFHPLPRMHGPAPTGGYTIPAIRCIEGA